MYKIGDTVDISNFTNKSLELFKELFCLDDSDIKTWEDVHFKVLSVRDCKGRNKLVYNTDHGHGFIYVTLILE